jgi:hypothetical protein
MKKSDLKQLIKPLVRECIHEVLLEEGLLSNVVSEVAKGMQGNLMVESQPARQQPVSQNENIFTKDLQRERKKLLGQLGKDAYNGVDLFENTSPSQEDPSPGSIDLGAPNDAGVDISSIMGNAPQIWRSMK